jgi:hypothetical protein
LGGRGGPGDELPSFGCFWDSPQVRRVLLAITMLGVLGVAGPADGFHSETLPAQWSLWKVSPSGRYLVISVVYGGCDQAPHVTDVQESTTAVTLTVMQQKGVPDPGEGPLICPSILKVDQLGVHLSRPLAGRRLAGQWRLSVAPSGARGVAPRMIGARAGDAMRGLANASVHTRLIGPVDGTVIRQSPAPGNPYSAVKGMTLVAK